ncbi:hypothetical protein [Sporosarcina sp. USHLN248]|uniref:hypothetical protein n=1 Tax=Sporosarcina sp. USHLN248 TaxID=3081300 RepID=UPI0030164556
MNEKYFEMDCAMMEIILDRFKSSLTDLESLRIVESMQQDLQKIRDKHINP